MPQNNQQFERLKQKYQPVLNLMRQLQVQVEGVNLAGTKLSIRGVAPSAEVKNQIWDQIKRIDANFSYLVCDISVSQQGSGANSSRRRDRLNSAMFSDREL